IILGLDALYNAAEGKLDAETLEVGTVTLEEKQFRKLTSEEVESYVSQILEMHIESEESDEEETDEKSEDESKDENEE
ncbi:MAG: proteasome subunit alpha, partial [Methanosarcinaceae archaeon]|nr:proteasome subunit alpha [Methanosarcinaceae archaeon]